MVIEDVKTRNKGRTLVNRLSSLVTKHTNVKPHEYDLWGLWKLRSGIVHEAIGGILERDTHQISAGNINQLRSLYFLALLFVLDLQAKASSLAEIWSNLKAYQPSLTITPDKVPLLVHVMDIFREQTSA